MCSSRVDTRVCATRAPIRYVQVTNLVARYVATTSKASTKRVDNTTDVPGTAETNANVVNTVERYGTEIRVSESKPRYSRFATFG